jgi:NADH:ubiquinone oxidoreductase subunit
MGIFSEIFSWWGGNTWSNRLYTSLRGKLVGTDAAGNRYYVQRKGIGPLGMPRRWVIYSNGAEASQITPDWHGWMHYTVDTPPTEQNYQPRPWQKPHRMNMTGTAQADRPRGSILATGRRPKATGDYKPWRPA